MKRIYFVMLAVLVGIILSSCGGIPTLPSMDSTVTMKTPQVTVAPELATEPGQVDHQTLTQTPAESASEPPGEVIIQPQPTQTQDQPSDLDEIVVTETPITAVTDEATTAPEPTQMPASYPYTVQALNPLYLTNFTRQELGCDWLGIGGQIFNREGVVQKDIIIKVGGEIAGSPVIEEMTLPLAEPDIDIAYGPGGYELTLANSPAESDGTLWIQLISLQGDPLTEQIYLITYDDCQKNLLLMNFIEK
jgi:hypothetical protein